MSFITLFTTSCSSKEISASRSAVFFDTFITVSIYNSNSEEVLDECMDLCSKYENLFSATIPESDIGKINSSKGMPVTVNSETLDVISDAITYSELTNGLYDITIYSVSKLWDFHNPNNQLPSSDAVNRAVKHVDYNNIIIDKDNHTITMQDPDACIDLGSIAKGYIADRICDYLISQQVESAVINIGGDIRVLGQKSNNQDFIIGVMDPNNDKDILTTLKLSDCCVATSGTYERYIMKDSVKYHHILNPATGMPVKTDIESVTVVTTLAKTADALCTSAILLGKDGALPLLESMDNTEALIVTYDKQIYMTSGMNALIIE